MCLTRLRDHAPVNNHFFADRFPFHFRHLHLRNRSARFLLAAGAESLHEISKPGDDEDDDRSDEDSLFHRKFIAALDGKKRPEAISSAVCASSNCSWSLINWILFWSKLFRAT